MTPEAKDDPALPAQPRYWVAEPEVDARLARKGWDKDWLLGWRDICRSADVRTAIASVFPRAAIGHTSPVALSRDPGVAGLYAKSTTLIGAPSAMLQAHLVVPVVRSPRASTPHTEKTW